MASRRKVSGKYVKRNDAGDYVGIAYYYKNLKTGLYYCGSTIRESNRKSIFKNVKYSYGGKKINAARMNYTDWEHDWEYMPFTITASTLDSLLDQLDYAESYLIKYYDSCRNGYNSNMGGSGRSSRSRILVVEKDGTQVIYNSCEDVARQYTMSPGNVYHYVYGKEDHRKKNGMIFLPIDDNTTMSTLPPTFLTTYSISIP